MMTEYQYFLSGNAPELYPADVRMGMLYYGDASTDLLLLPKRYPYEAEWGCIISTNILNRTEYPMPKRLRLEWLSVVEQRFFSIDTPLPTELMEQMWQEGSTDEDGYTHIVVGMAPGGGVAVWLVGGWRSALVAWMHAEEKQMTIEEFMPGTPMGTLEQYCAYYINNSTRAKEHIEKYGLPAANLYDNLMRQYDYRYRVDFLLWADDEQEWYEFDAAAVEADGEPLPALDYVEDKLIDGTFDRRHDGRLMDYHRAGLPQRTGIEWHLGKSRCTLYFWFDDRRLRVLIDLFCTLSDPFEFVLRVDPWGNQYQLLIGSGGRLHAVNESAYQYIVFKDGFELQRSDNYDQPRGAWIW